ncbi:MAG: F0F1 ATP synthase subunit B [Bacteroidaceae bacterium]|nr:F0F1 ATP synthase subunit B [Bacteroidaceae bacterium]
MENLPSILTPDLGLLFWMLLAFLVVFFVLAKFGFPAIISMVEERKKFIDDSIEDAKEANAKLLNIKQESEAILQQAREQQALLLKEASATKDAIIKEAKEKALSESAKIMEETRQQILVEKQNAIREIRSQVATLSVGIAEKILLKKLDNDNKQMEMIDRLLNEANISKGE